MSHISWYEFEDLVRTLVRNWGFLVFNAPVKKYDKEIDVCGEHILLYDYDRYGNKLPLTFIGECKRWSSPVDRDIIDQMFSLKHTFLNNDIPVIACVISWSDFTQRARRVAVEKGILLMTRTDIIEAVGSLVVTTDFKRGIQRKSLPNYGGLYRIERALLSAKQIQKHKREFAVSDIVQHLVNDPQFDYDPKKWANDLIQLACVLGLAEQRIEGRQYLYSLTPFGRAYLELLKNDFIRARQYLSMTIVKKPWFRETLLYLAVHRSAGQKEILDALVGFRQGFDYVSIQVALRIAEDLNLVEVSSTRPKVYKISSKAIKNIWGQ